MDIEINEVQEIIKNLESGGEISIKEGKYLKVAKLCVQMASENVALKAFVGECAIAQGEGNWTRDVEKTVYVPATEWMPPTPATDRIVAGIKADGVEEEPFGFVSRSRDLVVIELNGDQHIRDGMPVFVKALREGAK